MYSFWFGSRPFISARCFTLYFVWNFRKILLEKWLVRLKIKRNVQLSLFERKSSLNTLALFHNFFHKLFFVVIYTLLLFWDHRLLTLIADCLLDFSKFHILTRLELRRGSSGYISNLCLRFRKARPEKYLVKTWPFYPVRKLSL